MRRGLWTPEHQESQVFIPAEMDFKDVLHGDDKNKTSRKCLMAIWFIYIPVWPDNEMGDKQKELKLWFL